MLKLGAFSLFYVKPPMSCEKSGDNDNNIRQRFTSTSG